MSISFNSIADVFKDHLLRQGVIPVTEDTKKYGHISLSAVRESGNIYHHPPISALVCDIYGTLFLSSSGDISLDNTKGLEKQTLELLLSKYSIVDAPENITNALQEAINADHAVKKMRGIDYPEVDIREIWRSVKPLSHLPADSIAFFAAEYEAVMNPVAPMPGLEQLVDCAPPLLGIVSNAQFYTLALFQGLLRQPMSVLGFHPDLQVYSFQEGYAKPSLRLYELLAERLKGLSSPVLPEETLYIGNDMLKDVWAASQLGFQTALFAGDARSFRPRTSDSRCKHLKADYVLDRLDDICLLFSN